MRKTNKWPCWVGDLYGIATSVIAFIGEKSSEVTSLYLAEDLVSLLQNLPTNLQVRISDFDKLNLPLLDHFGWAALRHLLRRPWLYRIWIIQEFAFARAVTMVCSSRVLPSNLPENLVPKCNRHRLDSIVTR
jgi:hypothetical protein